MKASVFVVLSFALVLSLVLLLSTTGVAAQPGEINVDELIDLHNSHVDHSEEAENDLDHVRKYHPERVAELENKLKLLQEQKQQLVTPLQKGVVNVLTEANFDSLIATRELVMVNFYADWCRFSQMLNPIYDGTASHLGQLDVGERIVLAKVNSEMEKALAMRFKITKYPTLKLFRDGKLLRKEYRGERSAAAIIDFLSQLLVKEPVKRFNSVADLHAIQSQSNKEIITVIREDMKNSQFFEAFKEVAAILNEDCAFYYTTNVEEAAKMGMEPSKVYFNSRGSALESFNKDWNQEEFKSW